MKRGGLIAVTLGLLAWSSVSQAGAPVTTRSASASLQVGLRIVESCAIHADGSAAATQVECAYGTPYQLIQPAPASQMSANGAVLTVAF